MAQNEIEILVKAEVKKAIGNMKQFESSAVKNTKKISGGLAKLKGSYAGIGIAIAAVALTAKKLLTSFGKQEKAQKTLSAAMKQAGTFTEEAFRHNLEFASSLQKITTFGDETILTVQKLLTNFGFEGEALDKLTRATLDLAAAKGMTLASAADLVAKSVGSSTNALSRYGITVTGAVGSTERMEEAVTNITKLFGGAAAAEAQTFTGKVEQLKNRVGDIFEVMGSKLIPIIVKVIDGFAKLSPNVQTAIVAIGILVPALIALNVALGPLGLAFIALGVVTAVVAVNMTDINTQGKVTIDQYKELDTLLNKQLAQSGNINKQNELRIKQNNILIKQREKDIRLLQEHFDKNQQNGKVIDFITGKTFTQNDVNKEKAKIQKEINALVKENTAINKGGVVIKSQNIVLTKEELAMLKKLQTQQTISAEERIEQLEKLRKRVKGNAEQEKLVGDEILKIKKKLNDDLDKLDKEKLDKDKENADKEKEERERVLDAIVALEIEAFNLITQLSNQKFDKLIAGLQAEKQALIDNKEEVLEIENTFQTQLNEIALQEAIAKELLLAKEIEDAKRAGDTELANEKQKELDKLVLQRKAAEEQAKIDKKQADDQKKIDDQLVIDLKVKDDAIAAAKKEQAIKQKKADLIQASINTALAVTRALSSSAPPLNIVLAALSGALGATQVAAIAAKPIPAFAGGVDNFGGGLALVGERGAELVNLPRGSSVIPNNQIDNSVGSVIVENVNLPNVSDVATFRIEMEKMQREFGTLSFGG